MTRIPLFGVEYQTDYDRTTYELFGDLNKAKEFAETVVALYIFMAHFDTENVWQEKEMLGTSQFQYEDHADLYENSEIIETYITPEDGLEAFSNLIDSFADSDDKLEYEAKLSVLNDHIQMLEQKVKIFEEKLG
jgi:hypothetical protein